MKNFLLLLLAIPGLFFLNACGGNVSPAPTSTPTLPPTAAVTHLSIVLPAMITSGTTFNFPITAQDASNSVVAGYSGTVHFASSDSHAVLPKDATLNNGMSSFAATFMSVGNQTITAADTLKGSITGISNSIQVVKIGTLAIAAGVPPNGSVGASYGGSHSITKDHATVTFTGWPLEATGGTSGFHWSWMAANGSSLPPGLNVEVLTLQSGGSTRCCVTVNVPVMGGTPTTAGTYNVIVTVTDSASPAAQASAPYTITIMAAAAQAQRELRKEVSPRYKLFDVGTFGGANSNVAVPFFDGIAAASLSSTGTLAGSAETSTPDPFAPVCFNFDCLASHALAWKDGTLNDLGALPRMAGLSSASTWTSTNGLIAGYSENGEIDPFLGIPAEHAVLWHNGKIHDLGTLAGGYESIASAVNNRGEVVGFASNDMADPNSLLQFGTQTRAVLWRNGVIRDLGTLGGTDAAALYVNQRGQIIGESYTVNSIPGPVLHCGDSSLTQHAFLWDNDRMLDLSTLGGNCAFAYALNDFGQIVGQANLPGDQFSHPFLWERGAMKDLGALGGDYGYASWINNSGEISGAASTQGDQDLVATLWKDEEAINLGTLPGNSCSAADAINSVGQVVGGSGFNAARFFPACTDALEHAVLWENGQIVDLNQFVPASSQLTLNEATFINDRGEISGFASLPSGDTRAFVLVPCREEDSEGCQEAATDASLSATRRSSPGTNSLAMSNVRHNGMRGGKVAGARERRAPESSNALAATSSAPLNMVVSALNTYQISISWQEAAGQNQSGFNVYRCRGCATPRTVGTKIASVSASVLTYVDGSIASPLIESTAYAYQVTAFNASGESGPSNTASVNTKTEPAPTNLFSFAFSRGFDDIVRLSWTNNSTDDDSYFVESCTGITCSNFSVIAQLGANATNYAQYFQFAPDPTLRYRVRAHSPGGFSSYSNIRNQALP